MSEVDKLILLYPEIFKDFRRPMSVGNGWFSILEHLCVCLSMHSKQNNLDFSFIKIYNKFGTLVIDRRGDDSFSNMVVRYAERLSFRTCEQCGKRGHIHSSDGTQWGKIATLCSDDALRILYKRL